MTYLNLNVKCSIELFQVKPVIISFFIVNISMEKAIIVY